MKAEDKLDFIKDYYAGNLHFLSFIMGFTYDALEKDDPILDKKFNNAARVGCLTGMLLAIKEDLVEKKENLTYDSKIFLEDLEVAVNIIATKTDKGYEIGGYVFKDAPTLFAEIRNKLAHGNFKLDLNHSRIILNKDGQDIKINIKKLCAFVLAATVKHAKRSDKDEYNRNFILTKKALAKRTKPITDKEELKRFLKTYYQISFKVKRKDGNPVEHYITEAFESLTALYKETLDNSLLFEFKKSISEKYDFTWEIIKPNNKNLDDLAETLLTILPDNLPYENQIVAITYEMVSYLNPIYETYNPILAGAHCLMLLDVIYEHTSSNKTFIVDEVVKKYGETYFNYNEIAVATMNVFNALFSYSMDDLYKNNNEYTNNENDGLDYSKLDLSDITPIKYTINNPLKNELLIQRNAKESKLADTLVNLEQANNNLKKVKEKGNAKAEVAINNSISRFSGIKDLLKQEIKVINDRIKEMDVYEIRNEKHLKNKAIIEGIRNAIAHGNYIVKRNKSIEETRIVFADIYNGEITFLCDMPLKMLVLMELKNYSVIDNYVDEKNKTKSL